MRSVARRAPRLLSRGWLNKLETILGCLGPLTESFCGRLLGVRVGPRTAHLLAASLAPLPHSPPLTADAEFLPVTRAPGTGDPPGTPASLSPASGAPAGVSLHKLQGKLCKGEAQTGRGPSFLTQPSGEFV